MRTQRMGRAASAPWCGSALIPPFSQSAQWLAMPCDLRLAFCVTRRCLRMPVRARPSTRLSQSPLQLQRRWVRLCMTRVVSKVTLRFRRSQSDCLLLHLMHLATWYFADSHRSPPQPAAVREICLHMRRDPNTGYPRMPGWIRWESIALTTINMMKRRSHQVLRRRMLAAGELLYDFGLL
jgi:hypothetical protein